MIRSWCFLELIAADRHWTQTDLDLNAGDWVTTLAIGHGNQADGAIPLWMRVGCKGTIMRSPRNTYSFLAGESGVLQLMTPMNIGVSIGVLLWNGPTLRGLKQIARLGELDEMVDAEIDRIRNEEPPERWRYDRLLDPVRSGSGSGC
ncbi:MAG: hypothetical protein KIS79_04410 [Burkholderiales bacterium]|nr:hypothetical protein [Burkholderiales bacterium]